MFSTISINDAMADEEVNGGGWLVWQGCRFWMPSFTEFDPGKWLWMIQAVEAEGSTSIERLLLIVTVNSCEYFGDRAISCLLVLTRDKKRLYVCLW